MGIAMEPAQAGCALRGVVQVRDFGVVLDLLRRVHPTAESKKWFRVADTYGVEVAPGQDPALLLAITVVLDTMAHEAR